MEHMTYLIFLMASKKDNTNFGKGKGDASLQKSCNTPKKVFHVFLGGGDMDQLTDMHSSVIAFAKQLGCKELTMSGRVGWSRALKKHGWEHAHTTLYKEI